LGLVREHGETGADILNDGDELRVLPVTVDDIPLKCQLFWSGTLGPERFVELDPVEAGATDSQVLEYTRSLASGAVLGHEFPGEENAPDGVTTHNNLPWQ
jgi:hypothetical protein